MNCKLYVILGAGGVGKTTSAAAMALALAEEGRKTLVITVDPARRLAQVLGLSALSNDAQKIMRFDSGGEVSALWLDPEVAFENLVRRYESSVKNADFVLGHRLFKIIKSQLGGVEEYLGLEQVLRLGQSGDYDVCILDTPPSKHGLDFLESPKHLLSFFDDSVVKVFMKHEAAPSEGFFKKILSSGKSRAIDTFKNFLGKSFLSELGDLLENFEPVRAALQKTARGMETWIRDPSTDFVLLSVLERYPLDEARLLSLELEAHQLSHPSLLVLNKCLPATDFPLEILNESLGTQFSALLKARFDAQNKLRGEITSLAKRKVEVPRYSVKHLDREELLKMGRVMVSL